jgi:hypothetical protein
MHGNYLLLRKRRKVCAEIALLFLGYNLKRVVKEMGFNSIMEKLNELLRNSNQHFNWSIREIIAKNKYTKAKYALPILIL